MHPRGMQFIRREHADDTTTHYQALRHLVLNSLMVIMG
jgi:hypothetical protein